MVEILPNESDRNVFVEELKLWSTGANVPVNKRSANEDERKRVPVGESLHRKAWNQVKNEEDSIVSLFVVEKIMQNVGIYRTDHLPQVSPCDGSSNTGIDLFHVQNYSPTDLAITMTFLVLGLVEKGTLKFPIVPRVRAIKTNKPKYNSEALSIVNQKRAKCTGALIGIADIRSKYINISSIVLKDIAKFYELVNKVTDVDQGKSMAIFTQGRHDAFRKFASVSKKMNVNKDKKVDSDKLDSIAKAKKKASAMASRRKYDESDEENSTSSDDDEDEGIEHMMMAMGGRKRKIEDSENEDSDCSVWY